VTAGSIAAQRLRSHRLEGPALRGPAEVVRWLGAVQAQEYAVAKWGVGQRARSVTDAAVERAFTAGTILRTHVLRPTWHFVAPADIRWMLELTAPRIHAASAYRYRDLELDAATFRRSHAALSRALRDGESMTRAEIQAVLARAGISTPPGGRFSYLLLGAELDRVVCSGPRRGRQFTYALFDERAPGAGSLERDEALLTLTARYFLSRGPATAQDFAWWSGLTMADTKRGLDGCRSLLKSVVVEGRTFWLGRSAQPAPVKRPTAHLLPVYDEYPLAYKDRSEAMDPRLTRSAGLRADVPFTNPMVVNGRIVGHWKRTIRPRLVEIALYPLGTLTRAERTALSVAAERYGGFLGLSVQLT
jgi:hypothetical protein